MGGGGEEKNGMLEGGQTHRRNTRMQVQVASPNDVIVGVAAGDVPRDVHCSIWS